MTDAVELTLYTATQAATAIRNGEISSVALVTACLDRIAEADHEVQAWEHVDREKALAAAKYADQRVKVGKGARPLEGVPIGVKDIIDTADFPTENGCPIFRGRQPGEDAACVKALRAAGAIILGKTVTTELALLTPSRTRNPIDRNRSPGGSSAGSAAAVAARMVPAALGTQTAGSVLRPASYCGLFGFKPTKGLIPLQGVLPQSHTLDTVGVLTRSLQDAALLTDCMTGTATKLVEALATRIDPAPRFAFVRTQAWPEGEPAMQRALSEFASALGGYCEEIVIGELQAAIANQRLIQLAENASYYGPLYEAFPDLLSTGLTERLKTGFGLGAVPYINAIRCCEPSYQAVSAVLDKFDAILTPAAPGTAPTLDRGITGNPIFNGMWTYLGCPCLTLPLAQAEGMPIGVQLVGKRGEDGKLMRTARWLVEHAGR